MIQSAATGIRGCMALKSPLRQNLTSGRRLPQSAGRVGPGQGRALAGSAATCINLGANEATWT